MAYRYMDKAVYIRETTDGKTKWVKIPGVTIQNGHSVVRVFLDSRIYFNQGKKFTDSFTFEKKGRAE